MDFFALFSLAFCPHNLVRQVHAPVLIMITRKQKGKGEKKLHNPIELLPAELMPLRGEWSTISSCFPSLKDRRHRCM